MASSTLKQVNLLGKRNPQSDLETNQFLKKHKKKSEEDNKEVVLYVANLSPQTEISHIIDFFKDVGKVISVQLIINHDGKHVGYGFVQFASSTQATKALQKKNGGYLHDHKIILDKTNKISPPPKFCIDHKVCYEEDYLPRQKDYLDLETIRNDSPNSVEEEVLFVANLSPQTGMSHVIRFFKTVGEVVRVRLIVNHKSKHVGYAFVQFASASQAKKALEEKNRLYLHDHQIFLDVAKTAPCPPRPGYNLADKLCYEDYLRRISFLPEEDETVEGLDQNPNFVEALAIRKRMLGVNNLPGETEISDIIKFFKDVGEVVHVRRMLTSQGKYVDFSFVEFASAKEAKKALKKKNGEYLHDHKIKLETREKIAPPPKFCLDYKGWYEDYLRREGLLVEDETVEGLDETSDFVEAVPVRERTFFVANLPCETEISNIIHFFKDIGEIVHIRLIVNHMGKHVGCCFVEFASANEVKMVLEMKNFKRNRKIFLDAAKIAPYPLRPKQIDFRIYNLAEKLWYEEDHLPQEKLLIGEDETVEGLDETVEGLDETSDFFVEAAPVSERMLYVANIPFEFGIPEVIDFFKDVGEVVHVRLVVTSKGKHVGYGFVEFASADEANKALQKNGEYLQGRDIVIEKLNKTLAPHKNRIDHKVWYREDYLLKIPMLEETKPKLKKSLMGVFCGKKVIFSDEEE